MDFARKQLEKYGWTDGKGLGKNENGISQALKPKLKRSVTGIGHDPASEFNEHWWNTLYDKAAKNVEVEEKNGKTKKIKTKSNDKFIITNNTWRLNKDTEDNEEGQYSEYFVKTAILTKGGSKVEKIKEVKQIAEPKDVFKMTDEDLFAACEGRTAHKGARHGLKALGKLSRIAQQEEKLLTEAKYHGYSHSKYKQDSSDKIVEEANIITENDVVSKKKKKKKRCKSIEDVEIVALQLEPQVQKIFGEIANDVANLEKPSQNSKKFKKKNYKHICISESIDNVDSDIPQSKKLKRQKANDFDMEDLNKGSSVEKRVKIKKKKKIKDVES